MNKHLLMLLMALATGFVACNDDNDDNGTEQELITTVELHFTGSGIDRRFAVEDLDGDGGNPPVADTIQLPAQSGNLMCHIHVYDRSKNPEVDVTEEIEEEDEEHLFVFGVQVPGLSFLYNDADDNNAPVGIQTVWTTGQPGNGQLVVTLYHEPSDKGNLNNPGGDVDAQVTFPVVIQ